MTLSYDFDYDPFSEAVRNDPHPIYRRLRDEAPLYYMQKYDAWALSRFQDIWDASGRFFQVQAVGGWQTEKIDQQGNDNTIAGWILRFRYDILGGDLNVFHNNSGFTAFGGRRNDVLKSETGVRYEITDLLYLNFEVDFDYESHPASGAENEDLTMLLGIGVEL